VSIEVFGSNWVITLLCDVLPLEETGMFFDCFFNESWVFFYRFLLYLIRSRKDLILQAEDTVSIITLLKNFKNFTIVWEDVVRDKSIK
jgi:hypothetical protein